MADGNAEHRAVRKPVIDAALARLTHDTSRYSLEVKVVGGQNGVLPAEQLFRFNCHLELEKIACFSCCILGYSAL